MSGAKIIAVSNQKGGVGKTTTSVNLGASLAAAGIRVLLIDFDPQGNATSAVGRDPYDTPHIYHLLAGQATPEQVLFELEPGFMMISSGPDLAGFDVELVQAPDRAFVLKEGLKPLLGLFDFILIDCPPSLGLLTINALSAAETVLIPVQAEYFALEGLTRLLNTVDLVRESTNPRLKIEGLLLTMTSHTNLSSQVAAELRGHFGGLVYDAEIPRNVRLSEAPSHGKSVLAYDASSKGAESYVRLAEEFIRRNGRKP